MDKKINFILKRNYQELIEQHELLKDSNIISAYRRNKNLKDMLVRATLKPLQRTKSKVLENVFKNLTFVKNHTNGKTIQINQRFYPQSKNFIYIIVCSKCGKQYVGETGNTSATRIWQHKYIT